MNVCFITSVFLPELTGVSNHLYSMVGRFSKLGHTVLVLCPDYGIEKDIYPGYPAYRGEILENVTVRPVPSRRNLRRAESVNYQEGTSWSLEQVIGNFRPNIIHVEDPDRIYGLRLYGLEETIAYNDAIGLAFAKTENIPVVGFYHVNYGALADYYLPGDVPTPYRMDPTGVYKKIYGGYDEVLCSCGDACRHLTAHGLTNVRQGIYLGVDEKVFTTSERSPFIPQDNRIKILYGGRFDGGKDVRLVIEIFKKAYARNSQLQLCLAGAGDRETLAYVARECDDNRHIRYLGSLDLAELVKVYNSVDIYLSPFTDTFGLSIIEAMAKGLPVIASDQGGPASLIDNGINGLLCAETDDFIHRILELAEDNTVRSILGGNAEKTAQKYYGGNCARNLIDTYGEIINNRRKKVYGQ